VFGCNRVFSLQLKYFCLIYWGVKTSFKVSNDHTFVTQQGSTIVYSPNPEVPNVFLTYLLLQSLRMPVKTVCFRNSLCRRGTARHETSNNII